MLLVFFGFLFGFIFSGLYFKTGQKKFFFIGLAIVIATSIFG